MQSFNVPPKRMLWWSLVFFTMVPDELFFLVRLSFFLVSVYLDPSTPSKLKAVVSNSTHFIGRFGSANLQKQKWFTFLLSYFQIYHCTESNGSWNRMTTSKYDEHLRRLQKVISSGNWDGHWQSIDKNINSPGLKATMPMQLTLFNSKKLNIGFTDYGEMDNSSF